MSTLWAKFWLVGRPDFKNWVYEINEAEYMKVYK